MAGCRIGAHDAVAGSSTRYEEAAPILLETCSVSRDRAVDISGRHVLEPGIARQIVDAAVRPHSLNGSSVDRFIAILESSGRAPHLYEAAVYGLGVVLYARPDLIDERVPAALAGLLSYSGLHAATHDLAVDALTLCVSTPLAPRVVDLFVSCLLRTNLDPAARDAMLRGIGGVARRLPGAIDLETAISIAEGEPLPDARDALLGRLVEPCLFADPGARATSSALDRLLILYRETPALRYCLYSVAGRPSVPVAVRDAAAAASAGRFPLHEPVRKHLGSGRKRVLMIQSIADAQGDEIIRTVPLLQALLDFNRDLEVVLLTNRAYLYAHPRITLVPVAGRSVAGTAIWELFD